MRRVPASTRLQRARAPQSHGLRVRRRAGPRAGCPSSRRGLPCLPLGGRHRLSRRGVGRPPAVARPRQPARRHRVRRLRDVRGLQGLRRRLRCADLLRGCGGPADLRRVQAVLVRELRTRHGHLRRLPCLQVPRLRQHGRGVYGYLR